MNQSLISHFEGLGFKVYPMEPNNYNLLWAYSLTAMDRGTDCESLYKVPFATAEPDRIGYSEIIVIEGSQEERDTFFKKQYEGIFASILCSTFMPNGPEDSAEYYKDKKVLEGVCKLVAEIVKLKYPDLTKRIGNYVYEI